MGGVPTDASQTVRIHSAPCKSQKFTQQRSRTVEQELLLSPRLKKKFSKGRSSQSHPGQLERPAGFPSSDKTRPDSPVPTLQGPCQKRPNPGSSSWEIGGFCVVSSFVTRPAPARASWADCWALCYSRCDLDEQQRWGRHWIFPSSRMKRPSMSGRWFNGTSTFGGKKRKD